MVASTYPSQQTSLEPVSNVNIVSQQAAQVKPIDNDTSYCKDCCCDSIASLWCCLFITYPCWCCCADRCNDNKTDQTVS